MADTGGMLTRDRIEAVRQAADRLEEQDERIAIMTEPKEDPMKVDAYQEDWR